MRVDPSANPSNPQPLLNLTFGNGLVFEIRFTEVEVTEVMEAANTEEGNQVK